MQISSVTTLEMMLKCQRMTLSAKKRLAFLQIIIIVLLARVMYDWILVVDSCFSDVMSFFWR